MHLYSCTACKDFIFLQNCFFWSSTMSPQLRFTVLPKCNKKSAHTELCVLCIWADKKKKKYKDSNNNNHNDDSWVVWKGNSVKLESKPKDHTRCPNTWQGILKINFTVYFQSLPPKQYHSKRPSCITTLRSQVMRSHSTVKGKSEWLTSLSSTCSTSTQQQRSQEQEPAKQNTSNNLKQ